MSSIFTSLATGFCATSTEIVLGYSQPEGVGSVLFPEVEHPTGMGKIPKYGDRNFEAMDTRRSPFADSNETMPEKGQYIDIAVTEHDLSIPMDEAQQQMLEQAPVNGLAKDYLDVKKQNAKLAMSIIKNGHEYEAASLAQTLTTYPAAARTSLATTYQWDEPAATTTAVPLKDIDTYILEPVRKAVGRRPNVLVFGAEAWSLFKNHPSVLALFPNLDGFVTPDMIMGKNVYPHVKRIVVGESVIASQYGTSKADVWTEYVIGAYVNMDDPSTIDIRQPSFGYTIRPKKTQYTQYPYVDTYLSTNKKVHFTRVTDMYQVKVTMNDAGAIMKIK